MMNGNGSINMMNVAINNAQDTDRILTEQEIMSAPDCIDYALKHGKRPADYCSDKSFKAFWGMTKEEMYEKNLAEVRASDKTEQALNKMAKILDQTETDQEEIGSVFEKPQYPDLKDGLTEVKGIDQKNRDEATMSGPKGYGSSLDMLK